MLTHPLSIGHCLNSTRRRVTNLSKGYVMTKSLLASLFVILSLAACTGPIIMGTDAAIVYATKPSDPPEANTKDQIAEHQSWCYQTMGDSQCFAHPQNVPPDRLINTDPQSIYPVDVEAYHRALVARPPMAIPVAATGDPVMLDPAIVVSVEKDTLKTELAAPDAKAP